MDRASSGRRVRIHAPARLHFGFVDLNGGLGRRFGSLGLALDRPRLAIEIGEAGTLTVDGPEPNRLTRLAVAVADHLGVPPAARIAVREAIPPHAGLGSGTQLALAIAAGLAALHHRPFDAMAAAAALDRGNRSGVGLAAFTLGGLILDGGRRDEKTPPPVVARHPFPDEWRIVLMLDSGVSGIHGGAETAAFAGLPQFPDATAAHLSRLVVMRILPALVERDIVAFGEGITEMQARVGDFFAPHQGGRRFTSPAVADALAACRENGVSGIGQSSWGPTGYAIVASEAIARALVAALARPGFLAPHLRFVIARGRNGGAAIEAFRASDAVLAQP